ncbi:MAG: hypothetical protein ABW110_04040 [Steroidobacteraceae bacterium]
MSAIDHKATSTQTAIAALVSREWASYIEPLLPLAERLAGYLPHQEDAQLRRELYRSMFAELTSAFFGLLCTDPDYPEFWPFSCYPFSAFLGNPDSNALTAPISAQGTYRLSGYRGTVRRIDFQLGTGSFFPRGVPDDAYLGVTLANYFIDDDVHVGADGRFEVLLSRTRPDDYTGDWWELGAGTTYLLIRQVAYDWINEVDGRFAIERVDVPAIKPRPNAATLEENMKQIARWIEGSMRVSADYVQRIRANQGVNRIAYWDLVNYSAMTTQRYAYGGFDLQRDEALLIEVHVPEQVRYWSIHLSDDLGFTPDWMHHQINVNGCTAHIDKDGICRMVVSAVDPGVPNWLDTAGYRTGAIQARWEKCSSWPDHRTQVCKVADVRQFLPADTPRITAERRDAEIRNRRRGAQMRRRW